MLNSKYPNLEVNLTHLRENVKYYADRCAQQGIDIAGVVKGTHGIAQCVKQFEEGGAKQIASSRIEQLHVAKKYGIKIPLMLIRIPMLSEVKDVVEVCDISLNSETAVLEALNLEAGKAGKVHQVILMADLGDLREGYWNKAELICDAKRVEFEFDNLELLGIGTNVGCYGSIMPTKEKLDELVELAEDVEKEIGRKLRYISGGATSSVMRIFDGDMPERINHLRLGESILLSWDLDHLYHYDVSELHQDVYTVKAEVIEVKEKPSYPVGRIGFDAFGHRQTYTDRGIRKRALLGLGKVDIGECEAVKPRDEGIEVLGGSSDHLIIDVEELGHDISVGDIFEFDVNYTALVHLTSSKNVKVTFVE